MWGAAAQVAEVEQGMASVLFRGLAERTAARELLRAQEYEEDREWTRHGDAYYARFQEGYLCKIKYGAHWTLVLAWPDKSMRVLLRGPRKNIERYAQEIICYGPPGGPDYQGGELEWRTSDDDATVRAATIGGELRLMPWQGRQHLLLLVQNDHGVAVLGRGPRDVLLQTAEELRYERSADTLHLRLGDERINLHGLGSDSVVGYVDLQRGGEFVLGPVGDGDFGLFYKLGKHTRVVGVYTLAQVRHGDLGRTLAWSSNAGPVAQSRQSGVGIPHASEVAPTQPSPPVITATPLSGVAMATPSPEVTRPAPSPEVPRPAPSPEVPTATPSPEVTGPTPVTLCDQDLRLIERHLTLDRKPTGAGSTVVLLVLKGLRGLVVLGLADQLLRAEALRFLLADELRIHFDCCARTFRRALLAVARHTHLLKKVGHRWQLGFGQLRLENSELLGWIRAVTPSDTDEGECRETDPGTAQSAAHDRATPPAPMERRADHGIPPTAERAADPVPQVSVDPAGGHERSEVGDSRAERRPQAPADQSAAPEVSAPLLSADHTVHPGCPRPPASTDPIADHERAPHANNDPSMHDAAPERRETVTGAEPAASDQAPVSPRSGYQRRLRTDGKPTVWRRRWEPLPAEQSASRYPGKKPRGSPRR